jgi:hypothetical protein
MKDTNTIPLKLRNCLRCGDQFKARACVLCENCAEPYVPSCEHD